MMISKIFAATAAFFISLQVHCETLVVAVLDPAASDNNPGSARLPFRSISRAIEQLSPGDTLLVDDGVYRESVVIPEGLGLVGRTTAIRALHPGKAIIRGSDIFTAEFDEVVGEYVLPWSGHLEPQQVYFKGEPLRQIGGQVFEGYPDNPGHQLHRVHKREGGIWPGRGDITKGTHAGEFRYISARKEIRFTLNLGSQSHGVRFPAVSQSTSVSKASSAHGSPSSVDVEVSVRPYLLDARVSDFRLEGLVFEHSNTSALARQGAVKVFGQRNTVTGIVVRFADSICMQFFGGDSVLENSMLINCGQLGLNPRGRRMIIRNNKIVGNNTRGFNKWWEAGGIKAIGGDGLHESIIYGNLVVSNRGDGIWIDWLNSDIKIHRNIVARNEGFGIQYEASQGGDISGNLVYRNSQRGIYALESSRVGIYENTVVSNGMDGIAVANGARSGGDSRLVPRDNFVRNNLVAWNAINGVSIAGPDYGNRSDNNVFISSAKSTFSTGLTGLGDRRRLGISGWAAATGNDANSSDCISVLPSALESLLSQNEGVQKAAVDAVILDVLERDCQR